MKKEDRIYVLDTIDNDSFEYAFVDYSDFNEIEDKEFHVLRQAYLEARDNLAEYIGYLD